MVSKTPPQAPTPTKNAPLQNGALQIDPPEHIENGAGEFLEPFNENEEPFLDEGEESFEDALDDEEEFDLEIEDSEVPAKGPALPPKPPQETRKETHVAATQIAPEVPPEPFSVSSIPLTVSIELAELKISVKQLLQLQPGNMLDLAVTPDAPALLVVNGKIIGKGEIIKIGETLGVRILELGK